jgi:hypothetical protein
VVQHVSLASLLAKARQRCIWHLLLDHVALAASIAMAGAILLLLTGNQILNWYWIVLLVVGGIGVGVYRMRSRVPSAYALAQRIDRRLHLADTLSTATYFSSPEAEHTRTEASVRERQKAEAEQAARTVDVRVAVPFTRSRFAYPAVGLGLVAMGLFALRFAVTGSMSLEPSLVKMAFDTFFGSSNQQMAKNNRGQLPPNVKPPVDPGSPDSPSNPNDLAPDSVLDSTEVPEVNPDMADQVKSASQGPQQHDQANAEPGENGEKGDKGNDAGQENSPNDKGDNSKNGKQPDKQNSKEGSGKESSLMDKLRDAMANMMNKLKPQKDGQQQNSQSAQQNGKQDSSNQKGQQQKNQSASADKDAQQDQQQGDQGDKKQSADAKSGEKSSDKSSPQDSKSGVGSEDGDKSAREAELLQAMGKLSEILGKRSANVSGEVMVEVGSTKQQLKTPFSQRQAKHADAGGEIHRDEVPLMYQQFVQQYFEEIRKSPAAAPGKGAVSKEPASKDGKGAAKAKPAPAVP